MVRPVSEPRGNHTACGFEPCSHFGNLWLTRHAMSVHEAAQVVLERLLVAGRIDESEEPQCKLDVTLPTVLLALPKNAPPRLEGVQFVEELVEVAMVDAVANLLV